MSGPLQYGPGIKGYVVNLVIAQMISLKRVQQSIQTLIGQVLSEATILKYVIQLHYALEAWEQSAIEQLLQMPSLHVDETSLRVDRKNHWIHVYSAGDITLKRLHPKRGLVAMEDIGIIPRYGGVVIHDCWQSYLSYEHCDHALCGSHLLRELTFIVDSNGYAWASNIKRLLQENCAIVAKRPSKQLTEQEYKNLQKRYRNILTRGEKELPPIPPKQNGKRGKVAKSDAHNLWERLKKHEKAVLLFAKISHVPFTNNRAERDLRMSKVKQKVSGCFEQKNMPRPIVVSPAICRPWRIRDTIRWSPSKWHFRDRFMLMGVSSYVDVYNSHTDSNWATWAMFVISNTESVPATVVSVIDTIDAEQVPVTCKYKDELVSLPYTIPAEDMLVCAQSYKILPDGTTRLNKVVVKTTGDVPGGTVTAEINFDDALVKEIDKCVYIYDPQVTFGYDIPDLVGSLCAGEGDRVYEYAVTIGPYDVCGEYAAKNTATLIPDDTKISIEASWAVYVTVPCPALDMSTAESTSFSRDFDQWSIDKTAKDENGDVYYLPLPLGQQEPVDYFVDVTSDYTDSNWMVHWTGTVSNSNDDEASVTAVVASVGGTPVQVDCVGVSYPYSLQSKEIFDCYFDVAVSEPSIQVVTVEVITEGLVEGVETTSDVNFSTATISTTNGVADVYDTMVDGEYLGLVDAEEGDKLFAYSELLGPYAVCGEYVVENTATLVADTTRASSWDITVAVPCESVCVLPLEYWQLNTRDTAWTSLYYELFYKSDLTYYEEISNPPKRGNVYHLLAREYVAALLNALKGADMTAIVGEMSQANILFSTYSPQGVLDLGRKHEVVSLFRKLKVTIGQFNDGLLGDSVACDWQKK